MNIQVNPSQMIEKSHEIKNIRDSLLNIMDDIESLVLSANGNWQGDAERAFSEKIIYVKNQFCAISSFFDDYSDLLKSFALGYEQQESDLTEKINQA